MKKTLTLLASLMFISLPALAVSLHSLNKDKLTHLIENCTLTTISTITLNGELQNNTFTGYWGKDGKISGKFSKKPGDDPQQDQGNWTVKKDGSLCIAWDHWDNGKQYCVYAYETANTILFINENGKFESAALKEDIKSGNKIS